MCRYGRSGYGSKRKRLLIYTFIFISIIPSLNIKFVVFPDTWVNLYPITYYFIGAYLSEYMIEISKRKIILMLFLSSIGFSMLNFYLEYKTNFVEREYTSYGGLECMIMTMLIFLFCLQLNFDKVSKIVRSAIILLSKLSLGMYLLSWIVDTLIYKKFNDFVPNVYQRMNYAPFVILCSVVGSAVLSFCLTSVIDTVYQWVHFKTKKAQ